MDIMSALRHMAESIKEYIDNAFISFKKSQDLNETKRKQAKNNIGIYVGPEVHTNAQEGDIWFDTNDGVSSPIDEAEVIRALEQLDSIIGGMSE